MSDSDEFASYDPTTPAKPVALAKPTARRLGGGGTRAVAGPSSKSTIPEKKKGKKKGSPEEIVIDDSTSEHEQEMAVEDDDVVAAPPPARGKAKTNGTTKANPKGKSEPGPSKPSKPNRGTNSPGDPMEATNSGDAASKRALAAQQAREHKRVLRELESLRRQMDAVTSERDKYSKQLEELFQIRQTEPEQALQEQATQYEARLKTQDTLINELTTQLTRVKALGGSEKSYMLHFLTREAADEEKEAVEKEVSRWKDIVKQKDAQLAEKDERIVGLEEQAKLLRSDLAAEIERGRTLASRPPPPQVSRIHTKTVEDPKNGLVIRLYEDMTNMLVVSARIEKNSHFDLDEPTFTCVYTYREDTSDVGGISLNFSLHEHWDLPDGWESDRPMAKDDLLHKVTFEPRDLQNERPEFVEGLGFFKEPFNFSHDQMCTFLRTLAERMSDLASNEEEEEEKDQLEDDDVLVVS